MGDEAAGNDTPDVVHLPGHLSAMTQDTFFDYVRDTYVQVSNGDLLELDERLTGYAWRDRPSKSDAEEREQRKTLHKSAIAIREAAPAALLALERLQSALVAFNEAVGTNLWSARMLEEVFDIQHIASTALDPYPELFDPVRGFFVGHGGWASMKHDLHVLATLPVRSRLRTGRVGNQAMRRALATLRTFWKLHCPSDSWTRVILNRIDYIEDAKNECASQVNQLQGLCERFVVDMLTAAGFEFSLRELNGTWSSLDRELRRRRD